MARFLHTADWQIGKPFGNISDHKKRFRLQNERVRAISRIANAAIDYKVDAVLIAGDLFDSSTVPSEIIMEALENIGKIEVPVIVIPGNHDHGGAGGIWFRDDFLKESERRAPLLKIIQDRKPYILENATIIPCPLQRKQDTSDPTAWIQSIKWKEIPNNYPRIVLAHGSVIDFRPTDYENKNSNYNNRVNKIDLDKLPMSEIDYIALGDWHNLKEIRENIWYSGTPEADRFSLNSNERRSQVIVFEVERRATTKTTIVETGGIKWHNIRFQIRTTEDIDLLENRLEEYVGGKVGKDLLRIEFDANVSLVDFEKLEKILERLKTQTIHLRIKGKINKRPNKKELKDLTERIEDPLISSIALELNKTIQDIETIDNIENDMEDELQVTELALCELYRLSAKSEFIYK